MQQQCLVRSEIIILIILSRGSIENCTSPSSFVLLRRRHVLCTAVLILRSTSFVAILRIIDVKSSRTRQNSENSLEAKSIFLLLANIFGDCQQRELAIVFVANRRIDTTKSYFISPALQINSAAQSQQQALQAPNRCNNFNTAIHDVDEINFCRQPSDRR